MRKVMIVVVVLMMSCHVSLNPKIGPEHNHSTIMANAMQNAPGRPAMHEHHCASRLNLELFFSIRMGIVPNIVGQP